MFIPSGRGTRPFSFRLAISFPGFATRPFRSLQACLPRGPGFAFTTHGTATAWTRSLAKDVHRQRALGEQDIGEDDDVQPRARPPEAVQVVDVHDEAAGGGSTPLGRSQRIYNI